MEKYFEAFIIFTCERLSVQLWRPSRSPGRRPRRVAAVQTPPCPAPPLVRGPSSLALLMSRSQRGPQRGLLWTAQGLRGCPWVPQPWPSAFCFHYSVCFCVCLQELTLAGSVALRTVCSRSLWPVGTYRWRGLSSRMMILISKAALVWFRAAVWSVGCEFGVQRSCRAFFYVRKKKINISIFLVSVFCSKAGRALIVSSRYPVNGVFFFFFSNV